MFLVNSWHIVCRRFCSHLLRIFGEDSSSAISSDRDADCLAIVPVIRCRTLAGVQAHDGKQLSQVREWQAGHSFVVSVSQGALQMEQGIVSGAGMGEVTEGRTSNAVCIVSPVLETSCKMFRAPSSE